jgi:hypothetical protein
MLDAGFMMMRNNYFGFRYFESIFLDRPAK